MFKLRAEYALSGNNPRPKSSSDLKLALMWRNPCPPACGRSDLADLQIAKPDLDSTARVNLQADQTALEDAGLELRVVHRPHAIDRDGDVVA